MEKNGQSALKERMGGPLCVTPCGGTIDLLIREGKSCSGRGACKIMEEKNGQ